MSDASAAFKQGAAIVAMKQAHLDRFKLDHGSGFVMAFEDECVRAVADHRVQRHLDLVFPLLDGHSQVDALPRLETPSAIPLAVGALRVFQDFVG